MPEQDTFHAPRQHYVFNQILRFSLVGGLNTLVDLIVLNGLLWLFPTTSTPTLLAYNSLAYSLGAVNSFLLNKYWTFGHKQKTTRSELARFALTTLFGIAWSTLILWLASLVLHPFLVNTTVWANASKVIAIAGTSLISYLGMRLWVFVHSPQNRESAIQTALQQGHNEALTEHECDPYEDSSLRNSESSMFTAYSLSVVLPVYNEEDAIASTMKAVLTMLRTRVKDFEVIPVNDGSTDHTAIILAAIAEVVPQTRIITHEHNLGYGTTLADGFASASKELTFFMDSDGQFDIRELSYLLTFIDEFDAVIGYRIHRQDTWMRKLNAWGWKMLIRIVLGVHVWDIDCAFKLLHTDFLHQYPPETSGAMINAEMLYKLHRAGYTYREIGIHHLPRRGGRATGAKLRVIVRAFRELFIYSRKWRREDKMPVQQVLASKLHKR
ncbi:MAG: glycosyltransferase [Ktedonobacteraceae bacterium]